MSVLTVKAGERQGFSEPHFFYVDVPGNGASVRFTRGMYSVSLMLEPQAGGYLVCTDGTLNILAGHLSLHRLCFTKMAKLQAFIDVALEYSAHERKTTMAGFIRHPSRTDVTLRGAEDWLIRMNIFQEQSAEDEEVIQLFRSTEAYWLISYLLKESPETERLSDLGRRYGLSVSHFRRLTRKALGNTTKNTLCEWRRIRAVLDLMGGSGNVTETAFRHGYSSVSHFSNVIKTTFGLSPKELKNIIGRKSK